MNESAREVDFELSYPTHTASAGRRAIRLERHRFDL